VKENGEEREKRRERKTGEEKGRAGRMSSGGRRGKERTLRRQCKRQIKIFKHW
jgi:hypothetical protein